MTSHSTENYGLSQWERSDQVLMEDFNADNVKIDEALKEAADERAELTARVDAKAEQSDLTSEVAAITATLAKKGNLEVVTSTYKGNGKYSSYDNKLTFSKEPLFVLILGPDGRHMFLAPGCREAYSVGGSSFNNVVTWTGSTTVTWYTTGTSSVGQMNSNSTTYYVFSFYKAG